jgi:hypothetical protein
VLSTTIYGSCSAEVLAVLVMKPCTFASVLPEAVVDVSGFCLLQGDVEIAF